MAENNGQYDTVIGPDAKFKGDLEFDKGVRVLGQFEGRIATKGDLHIAKGGQLKADVNAGNVEIDGRIKGNVTASGKVLLKASAKLEGDLNTVRLEMVEGAVFVGNCLVGPRGESQTASAATESAKVPSKNSAPPKQKAALETSRK